MQLTKMAWRNVWRNSRRTWVTVVAMAVGLFVMIGYAGLVRGYLLDMEEQIVEVEIGDIQIHAPGYRDDPSLYKRVGALDTLLPQLDKAGFRAAPRLLGAGLAAAADNSSGAMLVGVDVARDARVTNVHTKVAKGTWLQADKPKGAVIGQWLARTLELQPGGELVLLSQAADGSTANEVYTVAGVLGPIGGGIDRAGVFLTAAAFRELMVVPKGAHRVLVRTPPGVGLAAASSQVSALAPELDVQSWRQLLPTLAQMFDSVQGAMTMMFLVIFVAVGIVLLNTMLMAVFERVREIGVLKALGFSPRAVMGLILLESAIQTGIALVAGVALSLPTLWYLKEHGIHMGSVTVMGVSTSQVWHAAPNAQTWILPITVLLFVVFMAVLYPASKAAWIRPVEAIRHR